nr:hypothetical protein [Tanacetum cinerariifolium]
MELIFETTSQFDVLTPTFVTPLHITTQPMTSSTIATTTPTSQAQILPTTIPSDIIQNLPSFGSLFRFDDRLRSLEQSFSKMNEAVKVTVQIQSDWLHEEAQRENDEFLRTVDENIKKIIKEHVKEQTVALKRRRDDDADKDEEPSARPDRGSKRRREGKEPDSASPPTETATRSAGRSTQRTISRQALASESAFAEEPIQTISHMEEPSHPEFDTELLAGPTYDLMKGSCKSLIELEYHLEEVYKATTDQLDWVNPKGQQYPHNLLQHLPLIPDNRGGLKTWCLGLCGYRNQ